MLKGVRMVVFVNDHYLGNLSNDLGFTVIVVALGPATHRLYNDLAISVRVL